MKLSAWEIILTILIFSAFLIITILNTYIIQKLTKAKKTIDSDRFWTLLALVTLSQLLIIPAGTLKILSFTFYLNSYQIEVTLINWFTFVALALTILTVVLLPKNK